MASGPFQARRSEARTICQSGDCCTGSDPPPFQWMPHRSRERATRGHAPHSGPQTTATSSAVPPPERWASMSAATASASSSGSVARCTESEPSSVAALAAPSRSASSSVAAVASGSSESTGRSIQGGSETVAPQAAASVRAWRSRGESRSVPSTQSSTPRSAGRGGASATRARRSGRSVEAVAARCAERATFTLESMPRWPSATRAAWASRASGSSPSQPWRRSVSMTPATAWATSRALPRRAAVSALSWAAACSRADSTTSSRSEGERSGRDARPRRCSIRSSAPCQSRG
nr:hypothetical protein [Deltaproteobacteria bacterium]